MKVTTDFCKKEIVKYVKEKEVFVKAILPELTEMQFKELLDIKKWKRTEKFKDGAMDSICRYFKCNVIKSKSFKNTLTAKCYTDLDDSSINSIEILAVDNTNINQKIKNCNSGNLTSLKYGYLISEDNDMVEPGYTVFCLVNNVTGYCDDDHVTKHLPNGVQNKVEEIMESTFEFAGTDEDLKLLLESNGIFPATYVAF